MLKTKVTLRQCEKYLQRIATFVCLLGSRSKSNKHYCHIYICCRHLIYIEANSNCNSYHNCPMLWQSRSKHFPSKISYLFFKPIHQALWTCIPLIFMEEQKKMKLIAVYLLATLQNNTTLSTDDVSIAFTY